MFLEPKCDADDVSRFGGIVLSMYSGDVETIMRFAMFVTRFDLFSFNSGIVLEKAFCKELAEYALFHKALKNKIRNRRKLTYNTYFVRVAQTKIS